MELSLIVVLLVGAALIWAGYQVFFAKKKSEVKSEPVAPYKLEPKTQVDSTVKPQVQPVVTESVGSTTLGANAVSVVESKPELKVVNGSKSKPAAKKPVARKSAAKKPATTAKKTTTKKPRTTTEK